MVSTSSFIEMAVLGSRGGVGWGRSGGEGR